MCREVDGFLLQAPHRPVRELGYAPQQAGVYISRWHHGSPAHRYNLYALHWLTELNGQPVPDLDSFVAIIKSLPDKSFARLKLCQLETTKTKVSRLLRILRYQKIVLVGPTRLHEEPEVLLNTMSDSCCVVPALLQAQQHSLFSLSSLDLGSTNFHLDYGALCYTC